jgi:hypothetical protein
VKRSFSCTLRGWPSFLFSVCGTGRLVESSDVAIFLELGSIGVFGILASASELDETLLLNGLLTWRMD